MHKIIFRKLRRRVIRKYKDIDPEDIFLDSANLPGFDENRFEGRIEKPIGSVTFLTLKFLLVIIALTFGLKLWNLGIIKGEVYANISENNRLEQTVIFANRGVIYDRNHLELATNAIKDEGREYAGRVYADLEGLSHVVGYLKYPSKDARGIYYDHEYQGRDGVEKIYNDILRGTNGLKLRETDALGEVTSESVQDKPVDGKPLVLSIDAKVSDRLYKVMKETSSARGFTGGAGVIMDVKTGEILALVSYPEYSANLLTNGKDKSAISALFNNPSKPFLNRVTSGLYTPGSILKPIVALAALNEGIISPEKKILSTGSITIPNPYNPSNPSVFNDWKAHGWTDMREALAVSSDVYFYAIGGGYGGQKGLGISNLDKYFQLFGLTEKTGIDLVAESAGIIPTPEWKAEKFDGDPWRLGDTYITSIGQYGTQVTPLEAVRFIAAVANSGKLIKPSVLIGGAVDPQIRSVEFAEADWKTVREGMRLGVTVGTSAGLNIPQVKVAAKTGTAELGAAKKYINSWSVGFFPYENPRYAFAVIMEKGPANNPIGATSVVRQLLDWMAIYTPEYFNIEY